MHDPVIGLHCEMLVAGCDKPGATHGVNLARKANHGERIEPICLRSTEDEACTDRRRGHKLPEQAPTKAAGRCLTSRTTLGAHRPLAESRADAPSLVATPSDGRDNLR